MRIAGLLLAALAPACLAYNPDCPPDETSVVGHVETLLDLRRSFIRTREAPVGNLITDAFYAHMAAEFGATLGIAVVNAGAVRDRTDCAAREFIDRGPVTLGQIADMLPFDNEVVLTEIGERDLWRALEHSVARLGDPGETGLAGQFLQVSHLRVSVDCSLQAAGDDIDGPIVGQRITGIEVIDADGHATPLDKVNPSPTTRYKVATNTFLADGGDGYTGIFARQAVPGELSRPDFVVVANYIADHTPVSPAVEGRITLATSCIEDVP
jgi:2',3'-cyclic-nucleotide 2'-phosphodiesterase (5'-nucleotidase family)